MNKYEVGGVRVIYNKETREWEKYKEPYATLLVQDKSDLERIKTALDKSVPKKVMPFSGNGLSKYLWNCPTCREDCIMPPDKYCMNCGQALDWARGKRKNGT